MTDQGRPNTVDEYIAGFPPDVRVILEKIRLTIRKAAPDVQETIKYHMPTFTLQGNLVYLAVHKQHIGLYPAPTGDAEFNRELSAYKGAKSSVRFPLDKPIPYDLISKIVKLRIQDDLKRAEARKKQK